MTRKIGLTLLLLSGLISSNAMANNVHPLAPNVSVQYELAPNVPETFSNVFFWTVKARCTINSATPENLLHVNMKRKSAKVNGEDLTEGTQKDVNIKSGDSLIIAADKGAQVELTNLGTSTIIATCSTV